MAFAVERPRLPNLFRIFYSTSYTVVFCVIIALTLVAPADSVYQAYKGNRLLDIFILTGVYILTGALALLIYSSRLYTNRSVLQDIPKEYIPIEKEDLPTRRVRKIIADSLIKSAVIAYQARPRSERPDERPPPASGRISALATSKQRARPTEPAWGTVAHPGWSSPSSPDLSNLQYATVVAELPHLIEAKAVSLAPPDPLGTPGMDGAPMPDERVAEILQRPAQMGLRQYTGRLISLNMIRDPVLANDFLSLYEQARFAADPLTEPEFRALMSVFAEILRNMSAPDEELIAQIEAEYAEYPSPDHRSEQSTLSDPTSLHRHRPPWRVSDDDSVPSSATDGDADPEEGGSPCTAPATRSVSQPTMSSAMVTARSGLSLRRMRSNTSMASGGSSSRSTGSVIRLAPAGSELPYTIDVPGLRRGP